MKYLPLDSQLFVDNRKRFAAKLKPNSIAIFHSNDEFPRSGDQNFVFKQNADLYYLSGIDQEKSILILFPDCPNPKFREVLLLLQTNEHIAIWEGHKYTKEEAQKASGIKEVHWLDSMDSILPMLMHWADNVYLNTNENDRYAHDVEYRDLRKAKELKARFPLHNYHRSAVIMRELRAVKSKIEIAAIKHACDITEKAFRRVLNFVKPGVAEYEIEAEITHEFLINRSTGHAYTPIIASGYNSCVLHYIDNNQVCKGGDIILFDFGAEYANYCADMSRVIPVNGKFTERQKAVYNSVLNVFHGAKKMLKPGNLIDEYHQNVGELMTEELIKLGLLKADEVKKQNPDSPLYKKYFMHGTSHHLGIDVHDFAYRHHKMEAGMVFTCEPGIYIPEENLGVRLENDILITNSGTEDLMKNIPLEAKDIEDIMQNGKK